MEQKYEMRERGSLIEIGDQFQLRESIEEKLKQKLGFFVSLQESTDDGEFVVYLHSDIFEDLEEKELDSLSQLGFDFYNEDKCWESLKDYLSISVVEWIDKTKLYEVMYQPTEGADFKTRNF